MDRLKEALSDTPVVLIHGPRQSGKTTLVRSLGETHGYSYFSFDDPMLVDVANSDPVGFVGNLPERAILDEVQRVPQIFTVLKSEVDRRRLPGRFLLTGSANVLLVPKLSESLAGRMGILRIHPLAQCEIAASESRFLEALFAGSFKTAKAERLGRSLLNRVVTGGYPEAVARRNPNRRAAWYHDYVETLTQRDVRDLARIRSLDVLPPLLDRAAAQTAQLFNGSDLASPFHLSYPTIREYVTLLERLFLLEELRPWHANRASRLVKTPKLHLGDTGLACALLNLDAEALEKDRKALGPLLETFVFQELRRQASWQEKGIRFYYFRDKYNHEVDIVLERGAHEIAGIEVKASATVTTSDFRGLRKFRDTVKKGFVSGVILYDGETCVSFGDDLYAVPLRLLWEMP
ncbi:MAG: ATP-binding protein [Acidobacteria bacterium]|nr:ATP-binding protein [Acidobacteriota bacterium]